MLNGVFYLAIRQGLLVGSNILLHIFLARKLGVAQYGVYGVLASFIALNDSVLMKASYETLSRYVAQNDASARTILRRGTGFFLMFCCCLSLGYFVLADRIAALLKDAGLSEFIRLCAVILPASCLSTVFLGALNGMRRYATQAGIAAVFVLLKVTLVVGLVWLGLSLRGVILGILIAELCQAALTWSFGRGIRGTEEFDRRQLYRFAFQLILVGVVGSVVINIDIFAVKMFLADNTRTGLYACAITIARMPVVLIYPLTLAMLPILARSFAAANESLINEGIADSLKYATIMIVPLALTILATRRECIALVYGSGFVMAAGALGILIFGSIAFSMKIALFNVIVAGGWPQRILLIGAISLVLEITLLRLLIGRMGIEGAALASTLTDTVGMGLAFGYLFRHRLKQTLKFAWVRTILPALVVYLVALSYSPQGWPLLFYYGALMILYIFLLAAFGELSIAKLRTVFRNGVRA